MDEVDLSQIEKELLTAGRAASKALIKAQEIVHEGMPLLELVEKVEAEIKACGCEPSFPLNVSINHIAAHDTVSLLDPPQTIPKFAVVKIDAGAHHNGYISDTAITVSFNREAEKIVEASRKALENAISNLKVNMTVSQLSAHIESTIRSYSVNPIYDLTGHTIERYNLHAGVSIPNVSNRLGFKLSPGVVFAIEPFTTTGSGEIAEDTTGKIFRGIKRVRSPIRFDERVMDYALRERKGLPFSDRWLSNIGQAQEVASSIRRLVRFGALYEYKVLLERSKGLVAQFEHTIFMSHDGPIVTTLRE
ncbi:type II methionyl aminopeptidase [Candidatus Marsarchaeota G1 archaeon OSP_B]|jgi:methionine aminopeptidase, type II|uniref:Methionine aminopeptidase n=4 Tax=Candidatus Marsarchaeota TaxID=1978152 RepID=A0A2R6ADB7_9ARCH|nr:MAG: type II methionyl aminopeptidase [Candidatus Marsarchaeota G1 archaeon OSP_D]PSN89476.1 MAG: type II methionyl aminopeptidase [Candidatus Marsarchaeota G1 archaeon OSP_C]PSN93974.1 MAG: type II methionyl aminopeptidase [Candidatus Marsarchaeota G1 archaeon OSP_B]